MSVVIQTEKKIEEIRAKARQEVSYLRATALREGAKNASDKELFELANAYVNSVKSNQQSKSRKVNK